MCVMTPVQVMDVETQNESLLPPPAPPAPEQRLRITLPGPSLPLDSHPDNVRRYVATHMKSPKMAPMSSEVAGPATAAAAGVPLIAPEKAAAPARFQGGFDQFVPLSPEMEEQLKQMGWLNKRLKPPATPQAEGAGALPAIGDKGLTAQTARTGQPAAQTTQTNGDQHVNPPAMASGANNGLPEQPAETSKHGLNEPMPKTNGPDHVSTLAKVIPDGKNKPLQINAVPLQVAAPAAGHTDQPKADVEPKLDQRQTYSRRAAANLISRLRENPKRVEGFPELRKMVFSDAKKSDLITMLCESNGALETLGTSLQAFEEYSHGESHRKKALRWTKKEMEDHYGADAQRVMDHKIQQGLVEDDENLPGAQLFLVSRKEDEEETHNRSGILSTLTTYRKYNPNISLCP